MDGQRDEDINRPADQHRQTDREREYTLIMIDEGNKDGEIDRQTDRQRDRKTGVGREDV